MVESSCPICASPVLPDQSHCARCGASLAGSPPDLESPPPEAPSADFLAAVDNEAYEDPRLSLILDPQPDEDPPEQSPGGHVPPPPALEPSAWGLRPSSTGSSPRQPGSSPSLQLGAKPISLAGREEAAATPEPPSGHELEVPVALPPASVPIAPEPVPQPEPPPAWARAPFAAPQPSAPLPIEVPAPFAAPPLIAAPLPIEAPAPFAAPPLIAAPEPFAAPPLIAAPEPFAAPPLMAAPPAAEIAPRLPEQTPAAAAPKESVQELVAFGLVAAGVSIGIASLFLPWAGATGIGIGTEMVAGSPPPPNQWGWGMPAAFPLFLLSLPVLVGAGASDRLQARFPKFALVVSRVTDLILPIILGGLYLGVALMYMTVPANYGPGLYLGQFALALGAGLMIAGAIVTVFFPPTVDRMPD